MLHLNIEDIAHQYAPYHTMAAFKQGAADYLAGRCQNLEGVVGQAYDRGAECAMRVQRHNDWIEENVGLN